MTIRPEIRDDNLRLVLSDQERDHIQKNLTGWKKVFLAATVYVMIVLLMMDVAGVLLLTVPVAAIFLVAAILNMMKYNKYREDHAAFLRKYNRR